MAQQSKPIQEREPKQGQVQLLKESVNPVKIPMAFSTKNTLNKFHKLKNLL
ncbi:hypothetical protein PP175_25410 (plasmid) [Aneurinibacillus sp. Ricciae_BoGa-3]|uniref:hypothetical protein n=1 Tax=Aneurinibacillus sp. Ricciae_BoGa-3 TaxID=3022697 RepID=UPI002341C0CE|nr:hypothetical protein [Aneurinibacillus sp. Ricciae_BoGa-3]WCK57408.1 hypothetical protein PP175_25410 [Aneurinibacillus sp. Ricciae_BoGa-3]